MVISVILVIQKRIYLVNFIMELEIVQKKIVSKILFNFLIHFIRFSHKELNDEGKKKFIIQHESFLVSAKNKFGKTKVDKKLNEYINEKKKINVNNNNQNVDNKLRFYIPIYYPYLILYDDQNVNNQCQIPFINFPTINQFKIGQQGIK